MYSLYQELIKDKISLAYFGQFNDEITMRLIHVCENYMSGSKELSKIVNKASYLIAESFQNLIRHGIKNIEEINEISNYRDFFNIAVFDDRVALCSANIIKNSEVDALSQKINHINSLDAQALKDLRRELLHNEEFSEKGGAGIGMVEMVKRSGLPLLFKIVKLTENYSLFILNIEIPINKEIKSHKLNIDTIEQVYKKIVDENKLVLYKGDFSPKSTNYLIEMIHKNLMDDDDLNSDRVKNVMAIFEIMQNASKHGKFIKGEKEGMFSLSVSNNEIFMECSNFVSEIEYQKLLMILEPIKSYSMEELNDVYKLRLKESYTSDDDVGMGIFEIAKYTKNTFDYNFVETDDGEVFYTIRINTN